MQTKQRHSAVLGIAVAVFGGLAVAANATTSNPPRPTCLGHKATLVLVQGHDIQGTAGPDVIVVKSQRATVDGHGGNDVICGGPGPDRLIGGPGNDQISGGGGNDTLYGGPGKNVLKGGPGVDTFVTRHGSSSTDAQHGETVNGVVVGRAPAPSPSPTSTVTRSLPRTG